MTYLIQKKYKKAQAYEVLLNMKNLRHFMDYIDITVVNIGRRFVVFYCVSFVSFVVVAVDW